MCHELLILGNNICLEKMLEVREEVQSNVDLILGPLNIPVCKVIAHWDGSQLG